MKHRIVAVFIMCALVLTACSTTNTPSDAYATAEQTGTKYANVSTGTLGNAYSSSGRILAAGGFISSALGTS